jgi:hypothetical protein
MRSHSAIPKAWKSVGLLTDIGLASKRQSACPYAKKLWPPLGKGGRAAASSHTYDVMTDVPQMSDRAPGKKFFRPIAREGHL